ncbi:MAG: hypothetical protein HC808_20625 [Candidatus Competibacteraceae bacterium]|nr:hypothetical protein [Candidatus Competibacteraceae bacterium]
MIISVARMVEMKGLAYGIEAIAAMVAAGVLAVLVLMGVFAPFLSPYDPTIAGRDLGSTAVAERRRNRPDIVLLGAVLALSAFGLLMIYSATRVAREQNQQLATFDMERQMILEAMTRNQNNKAAVARELGIPPVDTEAPLEGISTVSA